MSLKAGPSIQFQPAYAPFVELQEMPKMIKLILVRKSAMGIMAASMGGEA
jgi:hypothetical protein